MFFCNTIPLNVRTAAAVAGDKRCRLRSLVGVWVRFFTVSQNRRQINKATITYGKL